MATNMMDLMEEAVWRNFKNVDLGYDEYYTFGKKYAVLDLKEAQLAAIHIINCLRYMGAGERIIFSDRGRLLIKGCKTYVELDAEKKGLWFYVDNSSGYLKKTGNFVVPANGEIYTDGYIKPTMHYLCDPYETPFASSEELMHLLEMEKRMGLKTEYEYPSWQELLDLDKRDELQAKRLFVMMYKDITDELVEKYGEERVFGPDK